MGRNFWNRFKQPFKSVGNEITNITHNTHIGVDNFLPHIPFTHSTTFPLPPVVEDVLDSLDPIDRLKQNIEVFRDPEKRKKVGQIMEKAGSACGMIAFAQPELLPVCAGIEIGGIALDSSGKAHDAVVSGDYAGAMKHLANGVGKLSGKMGQVLEEEQREELKLDKIGSISKQIADNTDKGDKLLRKLLKIEKEELAEEKKDREQRGIIDKSHNQMLMASINNTKLQIEHDIQQDHVLDNELKAQQKNIDREEGIIQQQQESIQALIQAQQQSNQQGDNIVKAQQQSIDNLIKAVKQSTQNVKDEEQTIDNLVNNEIAERQENKNSGNQALDFVLNNFSRFESLPKKQKNRILDKLIQSGALAQFL